MTLVKSFYVLPTWTRTVALVAEHAALRQAIGCPEASAVPIVYMLAGNGIRPSVCIADKGYDAAPFYDGCGLRGIRPVAPLRETIFVKAGKAAPPKCEQGVWTFAGSDAKRGAAKSHCALRRVLARFRLDEGPPSPHAHPPGDRPVEDLYRSRVAVERTFGRLTHEWALLPLRIRGSTA